MLQQITGPIRYPELFDPEVMNRSGSLETARAGVLRALGQKPEWRVQRNEQLDRDTVIIQGHKSGFGTRHNAFIVLGQTEDNKVTICFKLFVLTLGDDVQFSLSGIPDSSYLPVHAKYLKGSRADSAARIRERDTQAFKKRIDDEIH